MSGSARWAAAYVVYGTAFVAGVYRRTIIAQWLGTRTVVVLAVFAMSVLATSATAANAGAPRLKKDPFMGSLGRPSWKIALAIQLDRPAGVREVTIDGRKAKVEDFGSAPSAGIYEAFIARRRMRPGHSYRVQLRMCRHGKCLRRDERVYLHRKFAG